MCECSRHRVLSFGLPRPESVHTFGAGDVPLSRRDWLITAGAAASVLCAAPSRALAKLTGRTIAYDYYASGILHGSQTTVISASGARDIVFEFNDRGRGPKLHSRIMLDAAGRVQTLRTIGNNYYKGPVDERFASTKAGASWKNAGEREAQHGSGRFYVSMDGTPEELAILARALMKAPENAMPLWPSGTAKLERLQSITVRAGAEMMPVTLYEISGLDFSPLQVWLDERGELFMGGSEWGAVIVRGWKAGMQPLLDAQTERAAARNREFARTLPQRSASAVAIIDAAVFDSRAGALKPASTLVFKDGRIVAVGPADRVTVPSDARTIDGKGKTVLPGLWDMHQHTAADFGPRLLAQGVTTIRDPGNSPQRIAKLQEQWESGELVGPRIIIAGLIDGKGPFTAPIGETADTPDDVIAQVRAWKKLGAVQIKLYSSLKPELVPVAAKEAHALGMRLSGHVPAFMTAEQAIHAGYDEIQHVNMLFLNFMFDDVKDTRSTARLVEPAKRAALIDLNGKPVRDFIALMKERDIVSDPTLGTFYDDYNARPGNLASSGYGDIADWLPAQVRRGLLNAGMPVPPGMDQRYRDSATAMMRMVKLLHDNDVRIVAGTDDTLPGFDLIRELMLYSQAGIPNAEVLQIATLRPAQVMKMDGALGSLEVGKIADAIVVHGDPVADINALRRVGTTIKNGVIYDTRALYATAGVIAPALA